LDEESPFKTPLSVEETPVVSASFMGIKGDFDSQGGLPLVLTEGKDRLKLMLSRSSLFEYTMVNGESGCQSPLDESVKQEDAVVGNVTGPTPKFLAR
jgi:hypothetical protein